MCGAPPGEKGAQAKLGEAVLCGDNLIAGIEEDQLGFREPGMVLASWISLGKKENAAWEFAPLATVMVSKDGKKKYTTLQEASNDLERAGGIYLHHEIIRPKMS